MLKFFQNSFSAKKCFRTEIIEVKQEKRKFLQIILKHKNTFCNC